MKLERMDEKLTLVIEFPCPDCKKHMDIEIDSTYGDNRAVCFDCKKSWPLNFDPGGNLTYS